MDGCSTGKTGQERMAREWRRGASLAGAVIVLLYSVGWTGSSQAQTGGPTHGLIMAVAGTPNSCSDGNSNPEPYGIVEREDPEVLARIEVLRDRISTVDDELRPITARVGQLEAVAKPLSENDAALLSSLRSERTRLARHREPLQEERSDLYSQIRLVTLSRRYRELPVRAGDQIEVRLMERDVFDDDICGIWSFRLDRVVLEGAYLELGNGLQTYVILAFKPR